MHLRDYDISQRYTATVRSSEPITAEDAEAEVRHIVMRVDDDFRFKAGQSIGVLLEEPDDFGNPYRMRLYSIANAPNPKSVEAGVEIELCVRRCSYLDPVSGERYPGMLSNYLCDASSGDTLTLTGPYGRNFQAPESPEANLLMIGTGTGMAPFRAFLHYLLDAQPERPGQVRLFYGAETGLERSYGNVPETDLGQYYEERTFKAFQILSAATHAGVPASLESVLEDNAGDAWELIQDPNTHVYVAGLSKIARVLDDTLGSAAGSDEVWQTTKRALMAQKRWSELLYD
ncbi:MAG: oxidoreductase [Gammaproteobacteria bacterium]|nr:MAG: oxidoreductase [Gammaproteobacteria bacterium]